MVPPHDVRTASGRSGEFADNAGHVGPVARLLLEHFRDQGTKDRRHRRGPLEVHLQGGLTARPMVQQNEEQGGAEAEHVPRLAPVSVVKPAMAPGLRRDNRWAYTRLWNRG